MKTMTMTHEEPRTLTLAELCEALEDGRLASERSGDYYVVRRNDLRRFAESNEPKIRTLNIRAIDRFFAVS